MCARLDQSWTWLQLVQLWGEALEALEAPEGLGQRFNLRPTEALWALARGPEGRWRLGQARFGWTVPWQAAPLINARSEGIEARPSFAQAWHQRRAVVPVAGYYEWAHLEGGGKQPWRFGPREGALLHLAGLWQRSEAGHIELCVITTAPNPLAARVHDRMPWVLAPSAVAGWLARGPWDQGAAPCPEAWLEAHPVDPRLGQRGVEGPACAQAYEVPTQGRLPGL